MEFVFLWTIVVVGLIGLAALGMAAHALVQVHRGIESRLCALTSNLGGNGWVTGEAMNRADSRELELLRKEKVNLSCELQEKIGEIKRLTSSMEELERHRHAELVDKEKAIRQEYHGLEEKTKQLESQIRDLESRKTEADAVEASIKEVAPYMYSYANWYYGEVKDQKEGKEISAIWRLCQGNRVMCERMLDVFRYSEVADRKQMYVQAAQLFETAYLQCQDATTLEDVRENVEQLLVQLDGGGKATYELQWPMTGTRWDGNTTKRQEENGQSTILAVVRPIVFDLKNMTVFSRGIVKTGG